MLYGNLLQRKKPLTFNEQVRDILEDFNNLLLVLIYY
jgi:hypothetical protein